ncbi:FKBP-type peptidyl-prolyl cis-trans isomerase [Phycisphaera mikurensis]|uniref:Peptidyl-prolyl cis-trans isomerase n=1 Tax=Phycisphaera mikurensis (strain NBRC 102666 / KCTC 22515 / FYK2301M01) TaxID=1142394 RepID=I0IAK4_PHYMF|nr:FKBP-type peptidyl-prolyl cis-trans isomerase [Phycisphaera mikurensis]MBB6441712.1 FKBP-type peptidyl-prolyl cis-trans isomerase [Phycisphaera mikurensis]BAM02292.1 peptidyl-prolyl cis-trans isomerase [Phycisphaera mikurensis NBRC 102666]
MKLSTRVLLTALSAGTLALAGVPTPPAAAQEGSPGDPLAGFQLPVESPPHDYDAGPDAEGFESLASRVSYAIGMNIGAGLVRDFDEMDAELDAGGLVSGIEEATAGEETRLDEAQVQSTLQAFQRQMAEQQMAAAAAAAEANRVEAEAFFARNAGEEGVTTTDSGLQYSLETRGDGEVAQEGQTVTLQYRGTLLDGTEFDSSYGGPEPASFPVGAVIPGFNEALLLLPVGSKGTIWIPADLAYGDTPPRGSVIEPGSPLVFDLEILGLEGEADPAAETEARDAAAGAAAAGGTPDPGAGDEAEETLNAEHRDVTAP